MTQSSINEYLLGSLFRVAGYALLALSLLDIIDIFVPLGFTNPVWEFQTANNLVERVPVPILGLVLVLVGEKSFQIFKFFSWTCLVVGLLFILLVPLVINSGWRIEQQGQQQLTQQTYQIQQLKQQLSQAKTDQEISSVLARLNPQASLSDIKNPRQVKSQVLSRVATTEQRLKIQKAEQASNRINLLETAIKTGLGALISGVMFLTVWRKTVKVIKHSKKW